MSINKPDISIIIVTYNAEKVLSACIKSIRMQSGINIEVIVVDNNSSDQTLEMLRQNFPEVKVCHREVSTGFAAGNNAGVKIAAADHILFLNPDTKFIQPDDLKKCLDKYLSIKHVGVLTCRIELALTGKLDETCHRGFPTPWASFTHFSKLGRIFPKTKLFGGYLQSYKDFSIEHEVDSVGGMFMLMHRQVGDSISWWDESFMLYGEDLDFCYRLREKGYKNIYWPGVTVLHYKGYSTGMSKHSRQLSKASKSTTKQVKIWSVEAMKTFYDKHYRKKYPALLNWLVYQGIFMMKLVRTKI